MDASGPHVNGAWMALFSDVRHKETGSQSMIELRKGSMALINTRINFLVNLIPFESMNLASNAKRTPVFVRFGGRRQDEELLGR